MGVNVDLVVEGHDDERGVGRFRGRVMAVALDARGSDETLAGPSAAATWLLVADEQRPAPVWVSQDAVSAQRLGR